MHPRPPSQDPFSGFYRTTFVHMDDAHFSDVSPFAFFFFLFFFLKIPAEVFSGRFVAKDPKWVGLQPTPGVGLQPSPGVGDN